MQTRGEEIRSLVKAAGGDPVVTSACGLRPGTTKKWPRIGIPERHWRTLIRLAGVSVDELHRVNEMVRAGNVNTEESAA